MIKISNVKTFGIKESIIASGYPMRINLPSPMVYDEKGHARARALAWTPIGEGHDNFLQGMIVQFDLTAPIKVWTEAQRYHWLDFVSSICGRLCW